jgi:hypothetical protein
MLAFSSTNSGSMLLCVIILGDRINASFEFLLMTRIDAFKSQVNGI